MLSKNLLQNARKAKEKEFHKIKASPEGFAFSVISVKMLLLFKKFSIIDHLI